LIKNFQTILNTAANSSVSPNLYQQIGALGNPCFICGDSNYAVKIGKVWRLSDLRSFKNFVSLFRA